MSLESIQTLEDLFNFLWQQGQSQYDQEPLSQVEHMYQAAKLAQEYQYPPEVVVACLFHDIGHLCFDAERLPDQLGARDHERLGAQLLTRLGFPPQVTDLIESHVLAKRYLVSFSHVYKNQLSVASQETLVHQGGPLNPIEIAQFQQKPNLKQCLELRRCDEESKVPNKHRLTSQILKEDFLRMCEQIMDR